MAEQDRNTARLVVVSGCSGGGKSTLLRELDRRGNAIIEEPGRRVIAQERVWRGPKSLGAFPWTDMTAFALRALEMAQGDHHWAMKVSGLVFFDRGIVDAAAALEHASGRPLLPALPGRLYNTRVFMTPPWPEIYVEDADRKHGFDEAVLEYERLLCAYGSLGYEIEVLPKIAPAARADLVLARLKGDAARGCPARGRYPPSVARRFSPDLAALAGYCQHRPNLGNVDGQCPSRMLADDPGDHVAAIDALTPQQQAMVGEHVARERARQNRSDR